MPLSAVAARRERERERERDGYCRLRSEPRGAKRPRDSPEDASSTAMKAELLTAAKPS
jgi:hypothetical protein